MSSTVTPQANWNHLLDGFLPYKPTVDGVQVTEEVVTALESGQFNAVPVLIGSNTNEGDRAVQAPSTALSVTRSAQPKHLFTPR